MHTTRLAEALPRVRNEIREAARRAGRDPDGVRLVAITKGHPLAVVEAALAAGVTDLGENRIEALERRLENVPAGSCRWHMVGHVQSRKAPRLRGRVHLLHSLDSSKLAERLERTAEPGDAPLSVLVQVNTSGERSKGGFEPEEAVERIGRILELGSLRVEGLMTMAPHVDDDTVLRDAFRRLRELQDRLVRELPGYRGEELSMGMTNDYRVAVEEGSTIVRLGTALFGEREG